MNVFSVLFVGAFVLVGIRNFQVREETFTELYFSDHQILPKNVEPNRDYSIQFTIHNKQNKDGEYPYQFVLQTDQGEQILYQDVLQIAQHDIQTTTVHFRVEPSFTTGKVILRLPDQDQVLHFRIFKK